MFHKYYISILNISIIISFCLVASVFGNSGDEKNALGSQGQIEKYPFKSGDGIKISTYPDTTSFLHNKTYSIDDEGYVNLPIVSRVNISRMTYEQLTAFMKDTYKSYVRSSNITIESMIRISLLGGFVNAGLYYVNKNNSLWDAVRLSGGPLLEDGIYNMRWERNGDEQDGDLVKYFESGVSLKRMGLQSGDQIWTPRPDTEKFWDKINKFMPFISLATTISFAYLTYQQNLLQIQLLRR